jgi:DNA (cytosine-5)-methyltransferase 1
MNGLSTNWSGNCRASPGLFTRPSRAALCCQNRGQQVGHNCGRSEGRRSSEPERASTAPNSSDGPFEMRVVRAAWPDYPVRATPDAPARKPMARVLRGAYARPQQRHEVPDPADLAAVRAWVAKASRPTAIDLFCGAGGLSLGLHDAGFSVLVGADSDSASVETHSANLGSLGYVGDLSDSRTFLKQLRQWGIRKVDLVAGGVPCQPFSRAGRSKIRHLVGHGRRPTIDVRAGLWRPFMDIVKALRPRAVLLENVPDLTAWNEGAALAGICDALAELGYRTDARLLSAFDHGVPQHRSRLVIVATRPGIAYLWPEKDRRHTVEDAIGDLPEVPPAQRSERLPYQGPGTSWFQQRMRRDVHVDDAAWIDDHITRDVRSDDAEAFALMSEGAIYRDLPKRLQRYRSDIFDDKYKRLAWSGLSRSITAHIAKDGYWYIHPGQNRTLSIREAARIQTFPDWFRFAGRPSQRYRQIGNAVPPLLAEAVGRPLVASLGRQVRGGRPSASSAHFRRDLQRWHAVNDQNLEWRASGDPWLVAVGAVCLSRANPAQASRRFPRLRELAPTPAAFLEKTRSGDELVGCASKAALAELRDMAQVILTEHGGNVPGAIEQLRQLPHMGEWLASAVLVYGFGKPAVVLDRGGARIASRLRGTEQSQWQARIDLRRLSGKEGPDEAFNSAMSDLGVLVCRGLPACSECPARRYCASAASVTGTAEEPTRGIRATGAKVATRD